MTLREWLDSYTHNGDAQLVCAWRKRAWRCMRPVVEKIAADLDTSIGWTVSKALTAIERAGDEARIKKTSKRWVQEFNKLKGILETDGRLWRSPTHDDRGVCSVAFDLVEQGQYEEAASLILEQAPFVYERPCTACSAPAGWCCEEITGDEHPRVATPQTDAAKAAGLRTWSRRALIVPHESRLT